MSVDTRLNPNVANLEALSALERQGLEGGQAQGAGGIEAASALALGEPLQTPAIDDGQRILDLKVWDDDGEHLLIAGEFRLGGTDLAQDLDAGVDGTVASLV